MSSMIRKPKTRKGKQILLAREPQLIEAAKHLLVVEGRKCTGNIKIFLRDLYQLKKPLCQVLNRSNDITPFEDPSSLEFLTLKNNCTLFALGSTSKKRPDNLVIGRLFEHEMLDLFELGIKQYASFQEFSADRVGTCVKPCLIFNGPKWNQSEELRRLRSLFIDTFHRDTVNAIRLQGIEHVISFTCLEDHTISLRSYKISLKKSGQKTPRIELTEIGPRCDFSVRRTKIASDELYKQSRKQPKEIRVTKKKNMSRDGLGNSFGRIHIGKQNIQKLQTRRMKGLKNVK